MSDWYQEQYESEPSADNPFGISALRLTLWNEMSAFLAKPGNTMIIWLKTKEVLKCSVI